MLCVGGSGFIFRCPMRCPAQLEGRLATVCLPRLRPSVLRFAVLLQALLFCCGLHHALRRSLSVVAGCLSNGRLRQQWACISVGAGCLGDGGRPFPTVSRTVCLGSFEIAVLFIPLGYPKRSVPAIPWAGPLSKSRSVSSPALSRLRLPVQQGTRTCAPCGECWVGPAAATLAAGFARQKYCLASRVFFILGNFPVLWATKISLEMQLRLTCLRIQRELQSWIVLTAPS